MLEDYSGEGQEETLESLSNHYRLPVKRNDTSNVSCIRQDYEQLLISIFCSKQPLQVWRKREYSASVGKYGDASNYYWPPTMGGREFRDPWRNYPFNAYWNLFFGQRGKQPVDAYWR